METKISFYDPIETFGLDLFDEVTKSSKCEAIRLIEVVKNFSKQTNQNNFNDGEPRSSNTCLRNLTRAIHNSDQVKDIMFSTGANEKPPLRRSNIINNFLTDTKSDIIVEQQKPNEYPIETKNKPLRSNLKQKQKISSRKKYYSSSSSSSSSDSSYSYSKKRKKRHKCRFSGHCNSQNHRINSCQHQCCGQNQVASSINGHVANNSMNNFNQCNSMNASLPQPNNNNMMYQQNPWLNCYTNQVNMDGMMSLPYEQTAYYSDQNYYLQPNMSDIIERIHKLDISINELAKGGDTCHCNSSNKAYMQSDFRPADYFESY